jgi:hypothetical protein
VHRDLWSIAALLMALMLPLQSFAAAAHCDSAAQASVAAHAHCAEHEHAANPQHHGCCADCCLAAAMAAALNWTLPRAAAPELFLPTLRTPLTVSLDRLDRPPRPIA